MKKETTTCLYSSFIKLTYMVNVHNTYCITVVPFSALRDRHGNKRTKEWNTQKIGERYRKSKREKINSNESDGWQMQEACKEREEMKVLASGQ